ncbi:XisI protein [Tumidithrix elongata RA019]|uniref:XisI protein n=1 Tax=Tumidithrix elongata BACA0141 TaxID=2716417 RepID=A0AAW9PR83_9CYAN|nr:XisI protein [Tumidithrix elongata RA019]
MDRLDRYRQIIRTVLKPYTDIRYANVNVKNRSAFDTETDQYIILSEGWDKLQHLHGVLIHVEIIDSKVWIQVDGTEDGIAQELLQSGVPKEDIVLGFHEPSIRPLTGFAVA